MVSHQVSFTTEFNSWNSDPRARISRSQPRTPKTRLSTKNIAKRCKDTLNLVDMAMFILDTMILQGKTLQLKSDMIDRLK